MPYDEIRSVEKKSAWTVFLVFLKLGCISFGGPIAHLSYLHNEFVMKRKWLTKKNYADLVALCQFLPGPASSQVGIALGFSRSGYMGALAAWAGFTLPSAILLILFAQGIINYGDIIPSGVLHGLKVATVAVVAQAFWGMSQHLCPDIPRISIMTATTCFILLIPSVLSQISVIIIASLVGLVLLKPIPAIAHEPLPITIQYRTGLLWLALFFTLLIGLPVLRTFYPTHTLAMIDTFYRVGSLVFGGGHVVLPLLQAEVVPTGWVNNDSFLAGYGAVQALPGPLFTFAAFLGGSMINTTSSWLSGILCLLAIFMPSFLLVIGTLPFWEHLRRHIRTQAALCGINAAVVGLLLAALYQPVWSSTIRTPQDFSLALIALVALMLWKLPPWFVVISSGIVGWLAQF